MRGGGLLNYAGQTESEGSAAACRAFAGEFTVHGQHELFDDTQTEAGRRFAAGGPRRKPAIAAEHVRLVLLGETWTFILDLTFDIPGAWLADRNTNLFAGR